VADDSTISLMLTSPLASTNPYNGLSFGYTDGTAQKCGIFFKRSDTNYRGNLIFALENTADISNVDPTDAKMILLAGGNLGLGTVIPQAKQHIVAADDAISLMITSSLAMIGKYSGISFGYEDGIMQKAGIFFQRKDNYSRGDLIFAIENTADISNVDPTDGKMAITAAGLVTITTTTDATALDTGSLQTAGGASVKKNLWVGENINLVTGKGMLVNALKVLGDRGAALTAQLTTITNTAPGTPDYAIADLTNTLPYGFVSKDEGNTVLAVIANLQTRVAELEARLGSSTGHGLFT
jgi:hypothetical protein